MRSWFIPYTGEKPAEVLINGHKFIILAHEKEELEDSLELVGADRLEAIEGGDTPEEQTAFLAEIARKVEGDIVITSPDMTVSDLLHNLGEKLPWVQ